MKIKELNLNALKKFFLKNQLSAGLGLLTLLMFFVPAALAGSVAPHPTGLIDVSFNAGDSLFNLLRVTIMVCFVLSVLRKLSVFRNFRHDLEQLPRGAIILTIILPLLVLLVSIAGVINPDWSTWLVRCDNVQQCGINFRHAVFVKAALEIAAAIIFARLAMKATRRSRVNRWQIIINAALMLVMVFMAGEELAWGQRIFSFDSPQLVRAVNAQGEFNLHDISTQLFQNVWYFGSWILLIALPFLRQPLTKLLIKTKKWSFLVNFLPPSYFIVAFAPVFGIIDPLWSSSGLRYGSILFSVVATAMILIYLIVPARGKLANQLCLSLSVFILAVFMSLLISTVWNKNSGAVTEYEEVFLAFGLTLWAWATWHNFHPSKKSSRSLVHGIDQKTNHG